MRKFGYPILQVYADDFSIIKNEQLFQLMTAYVHLFTCRDMGAFLESDNEVIMISTSILSLSRVVESIPFHCLKRPALFVDVLSVKEHPKDVLLRVCNSHQH